MRRRYLFPVLLLGAAGIASMVTSTASTPAHSYDYLDALVVDENYALATQWADTDIQHSEKLSDDDKVLFMRLLEAFDGQTSLPMDRQLFLDQAENIIENRECSPDKCVFDIFLNRTVEPKLIHGDLRLVQLEETSVRVPISASNRKTDIGAKIQQSRQVRYILTERGWVIKTVETTAQQNLHIDRAQALKTEKMSGLNYYPRSAPWDEFWIEFPVKDIERDLELVSELGANSLRVFLQHEHFANMDTREDSLARLVQFLDLSAARDLKVIVTLFDLRADYRIQNWSSDSAHMSTIFEAIHDHEALLAVDLKNQPDLDFKHIGEEGVLAWLDAMIASARHSYADIPLTIGWSDPSNAHNLSDQLNLITFHDYNDPDGLALRLKDLKSKVGHKPVFITEIGHSRWSLTGDKPNRQAARLEDQLSQLKTADGVFVWTLHDFEEIGSNIVGNRPWRKAQQKSYGITTPEGAWHPAAEAFHSFNQSFHSPSKGD